MIYLETEYRLAQLSDAEYHSAVRSVAISKKLNNITAVLKIALKHEDPELSKIVEGNAINLHTSYGNGGGMYTLAVAASIKALRLKNPEINPIVPTLWDEVMNRERELRDRPAVRTIEQLSGLGLLEVRGVNPGYVDGFQTSFQRPGFMEVSGVIGLAALHSHDFMHFASHS